MKMFANKCQPSVGMGDSEHLVTHENDRNPMLIVRSSLYHDCSLPRGTSGVRLLHIKGMVIASDPHWFI